MASTKKLEKLADDFMDVEVSFAPRRNPTRTARPVSVVAPEVRPKTKKENDESPQSRNELSKMLDNLNFNKLSSIVLPSASKSKSAPTPIEVKELNRKRLAFEKEANRVASNIMIFIKFYTSPLRLFLKAKARMMTEIDRVAFVDSLRISQRIKDDLKAEWGLHDMFGLKLLIKMYRMHTTIFPLFLKDHTDYMYYLMPPNKKIVKPGQPIDDPLKGPDNTHRRNVMFALYNHIMNPGTVTFPPGKVTSMELFDIHTYFDNFLAGEVDEVAAANFTISQFREIIRDKLVGEINVYATSVFALPIQCTYKEGKQYKKIKLNALQLISELYQMFSSFQGAEVISQQMLYWLQVEEDVENPVRGFNGGKYKKGKKL